MVLKPRESAEETSLRKPESLREFMRMRDEIAIAEGIESISEDVQGLVRKMMPMGYEVRQTVEKKKAQEIEDTIEQLKKKYEELRVEPSAEAIEALRAGVLHGEEAIRKKEQEEQEALYEKTERMSVKEEALARRATEIVIRKAAELGIDVRDNVATMEEIRIDVEIDKHDNVAGLAPPNGMITVNTVGALGEQEFVAIVAHEQCHRVGLRTQINVDDAKRHGNDKFPFWDEGIVKATDRELTIRAYENADGTSIWSGGYSTQRYVVELVCADIAEKEGVEFGDVLQYFQRGMMLGNIGYMRLLKQHYGREFIEMMTAWNHKTVYNKEVYTELKRIGLNPIEVDWGSLPDPEEDKETYKEELEELMSWDDRIEEKLVEYAEGQPSFADVMRRKETPLRRPEGIREFMRMRDEIAAQKEGRAMSEEAEKLLRTVGPMKSEVRDGWGEKKRSGEQQAKLRASLRAQGKKVDEAQMRKLSVEEREVRASRRETAEAREKETEALTRKERALAEQATNVVREKVAELGINVDANLAPLRQIRTVERMEEGGTGGASSVDGTITVVSAEALGDRAFFDHVMHEQFHRVGIRARVNANESRRHGTSERFRFWDEAIVSVSEKEAHVRTGGDARDVFAEESGYGANQYVLELVCIDIAKKEGVEFGDVVQYFQRGMMLGNVGYMRLMKQHYGAKFVRSIGELGAETLYDEKIYRMLKEVGLQPIELPWDTLPNMITERDAYEEEMSLAFEYDEGMPEALFEYVKGQAKFNTQRGMLAEENTVHA